MEWSAKVSREVPDWLRLLACISPRNYPLFASRFMLFHMNLGPRPACSLLFVLLFAAVRLPAQTPVVTQTNAAVRVMASNLSSGTLQRYETPGLNILKGLKPDVVAMQEFNYASTNGLGINTPAAIREMVDSTFGTNFVYFRETNSG